MSEEQEQYKFDLKGGDTVTILHGQALPQQEPEVIKIEGTITAPLNYAKVRTGQLDPQKSSLIVNGGHRSIKLRADDTNYYGATVKGKLDINPDLNKFGINSDSMYGSNELISLLKINRVFFEDRDACTALVKKLMNLKVESSNLMVKNSDNKGNAEAHLKRTVESTHDYDFKLSMPLFVGQEKQTFFVEVCMDVSDGGIRFWVESAELMELLHDQAEHILSEQVKEITNLVELPVLYQ